MSEYDVDVIMRLLPAGVRNAMRYEYMMTLVAEYKHTHKAIDYQSFIKNIIRKSLRQADAKWSQKQLFEKMRHNIYDDLQANPPLQPVYPETDSPHFEGVLLTGRLEGSSQLSSKNVMRRLREVDNMIKSPYAVTSWSPMENVPLPPSSGSV